jgi:hypothetical protein
MTESNIHDQISESIMTMIKKANIFDKIYETKNLTYKVFLFTTFTSSILLINSFYNSYIIDDINQKLKNKTIYFDNKIEKLNKKIDFIIETSVKNNQNLEFYLNKELSFNIKSEISSLTTEIIDNDNDNNDNKEDDELLNECYDNIPCNNIKKVTGVSRIFLW